MLQPHLALSEAVAAAAEAVIRGARHTHYQHDEVIDPASGTYDLDCSEFVSYVLERRVPKHYASIPRDPTQPCPRAFEYHDFLQGLGLTSAHGWRRVLRLCDAQRGDVIAWRFAEWSPGGDTGHVLIVAGAPQCAGPGVAAVLVYDSSDVPHGADSREHDGVFVSGVGMGTLLFQTDPSGGPDAVQFAPPDPFLPWPIVIGRLEPDATQAA